MTGDWRKSCMNTYNLYTSPDIFRTMKTRMRLAEHVARIRDVRNLHIILVGKHEGKRPLGGSICEWKSNNKTELWKIKWL